MVPGTSRKTERREKGKPQSLELRAKRVGVPVELFHDYCRFRNKQLDGKKMPKPEVFALLGVPFQ